MDLIYRSQPVRYDSKNMRDDIYRNTKRLLDCDLHAKALCQLVGRLIYHPIRDGNAVYQIIKENKRSVIIRVCTGIGDDWVIPAWGEEARIDKEKARDMIASRERVMKLFSQGGTK